MDSIIAKLEKVLTNPGMIPELTRDIADVRALIADAVKVAGEVRQLVEEISSLKALVTK